MEECRQGKSAKWISNFGKRIGSEGWARGSQLLELLTWRERTASCRPGDGLGTALSGAFPGRRTANSELVRTRGIRLDAHEWINEIPTVPVYYPAKPQPRERAWQNQRGKKTLLSLTLVRLCEMT
ncbi:hypothetical protein YC2023_072338 [Brassica napus]